MAESIESYKSYAANFFGLQKSCCSPPKGHFSQKKRKATNVMAPDIGSKRKISEDLTPKAVVATSPSTAGSGTSTENIKAHFVVNKSKRRPTGNRGNGARRRGADSEGARALIIQKITEFTSRNSLEIQVFFTLLIVCLPGNILTLLVNQGLVCQTYGEDGKCIAQLSNSTEDECTTSINPLLLELEKKSHCFEEPEHKHSADYLIKDNKVNRGVAIANMTIYTQNTVCELFQKDINITQDKTFADMLRLVECLYLGSEEYELLASENNGTIVAKEEIKQNVCSESNLKSWKTPSTEEKLGRSARCIVSLNKFKAGKLKKASKCQYQCHEEFRDYFSLMYYVRICIDGIGICIIGGIGLLGNIVTFIVLVKQMSYLEAPTNFSKLLMSLAFIDIVLLTLCIVEKSLFRTLIQCEPLWYSSAYSIFFYPIRKIATSSSIFMVVAISAERYKAICYPLRHRPSSWQYIVIVAMVAFFQNVPKFFEMERETDSDGNFIDYRPTTLIQNESYVVFTSWWDELISTGVAPFLALVYFNMKIYWKIRASANYRYRFVGNSSLSRRLSNVPIVSSGSTSNQHHSNISSSTKFPSDVDTRGGNARRFRSVLKNETACGMKNNPAKGLGGRKISGLSTTTACKDEGDPMGDNEASDRARQGAANQIELDNEKQIVNCSSSKVTTKSQTSVAHNVTNTRNDENSNSFCCWHSNRKDSHHQEEQQQQPSPQQVDVFRKRLCSYCLSTKDKCELQKVCTSKRRKKCKLVRSICNSVCRQKSSEEAGGPKTSVLHCFPKENGNACFSSEGCLSHLAPEFNLGHDPEIMELVKTDIFPSSEIPVVINSTLSRRTFHRYVNGQLHIRRSREKSTLILVSIVAMYFSCHILRLIVQAYIAANPTTSTAFHHRYCNSKGKFHVPVAAYIMVTLSNLLVVLSSSVNFIVYCVVEESFRKEIKQLSQDIKDALYFVFSSVWCTLF